MDGHLCEMGSSSITSITVQIGDEKESIHGIKKIDSNDIYHDEYKLRR